MKKRVLSLVVVFCILLGISANMPLSVNAYYETQYGDLYYEVNNENTEITITRCDENANIVIIPDEISGLPVTSIGECAFENCSTLTNITISNSVTSIGWKAFCGCSSLTSITIPYSVTRIDELVFTRCSSLTSINVYDGNKYFCSIDGNLFNNNKTELIQYAIGKTDISYDIPNGVISIGDNAFDGCNNLTSITIPNSVTSVGNSAFYECYNLININIPNSIVDIGYCAFMNCWNLRDITISDSVINIGHWAFNNCHNLESITIGKGVTNIGDAAFESCSRLTTIEVDDTNNTYSTDNIGCLFNKNKTSLIQYPLGRKEDSYIVPNGVTDIARQAFYEAENLNKITIPDSVTRVGLFAFKCTGYYYDKNNWSNGILYIDNILVEADAEICSGEVFIKPNTTCIAEAAFINCNLTSVTLPDSVISICKDAFAGIETLTDIKMSKNIRYIGNCAFQYCYNLKSIILPNSLTNLGEYSFDGCENLTEAVIGDSVTNIASGAFYYCRNLISIIIPSNVTTIGDRAFYECNALKNIILPKSITHIGNGTFPLYGSLTDIYYDGKEEDLWNIDCDWTMTELLNKVTVHYNSGKTFTPTNTNPSKPNSGDSDYVYGISGGSGRGHKKTTDVRERLKNSAEDFNNAALEYTAAVSKSAKKQMGTADDIESLANKLETENRILFTTSPDSKTKKAAYIGYAKYLNQMIEEGISLNKINLSDSSIMIDYKLTSQILSKLRGKKLNYEYKGYTIKINSLAISKSYFGTLDVFTPKGGKISAMISSDTNKTMADLQDFANQLKDVAQDVNKKALRTVVSDLVNLTGLGNLGTLIARDGLKSYKPLTKLGYGDVVKNVKKCYSGYEAVKGILNCAQINSLDSIIDNPKQLTKKINNLCEHESNIENAVVNAAQDKLIDSLYNLLYTSQAYEEMRNGKQPTFQERVKDFFDKTTSWISSIFQCPVDFTVYDENGTMIGYVDDGAVYYNDDIYIEVNGDVKTLYVPVGMKVDIKMTGTDEGEFNYILEEVIYNKPTGRLNYYGLPLGEGVEYTQNLDTTEFDNSTDVLPITSQDGNVLPNEYISSEDTTAYVIINTDSDNGGTVLGGGEYAKGDSVELSAVPINSNYEFNGWYVEDELISVDNIYRFTAIENTDIHAEFMRVYNEDDAYEMQIPNISNDIYPYIYKDYDGSKGVVIVPFTEELADNMQIYVTTYATDGSILNNEVLCSATLNENGIYAFENVDLENATKVVIKDENKIEIASAYYDSNKDIADVEIEVSDKYSDSLNVTARKELGNIVVNFDILDDKINQDDIVAYLAEYDENGILLSCTILNETTTENGIEFDAYLGDNYKLMFWDNNMCPITETITSDLIEI